MAGLAQTGPLDARERRPHLVVLKLHAQKKYQLVGVKPRPPDSDRRGLTNRATLSYCRENTRSAI